MTACLCGVCGCHGIVTFNPIDISCLGEAGNTGLVVKVTGNIKT